MAQMMYHLFTKHGVMPSVIYKAPIGEYTLIKTLFNIEMEIEAKKIKAL
jgi:hypothetical protein